MLDRRGTALRRSTPALQSRTLVHVCFLDVEVVDIDDSAIVLRLLARVRDGAAQRLVDDLGALLLAELKNRTRLVHLLAANQVDHQPHLAWAVPVVPRNRSGFHHISYLPAGLAFLSASLPP